MQTIPATHLAPYYVLYNTAPPLICGGKTKTSCQSAEQTEPQHLSAVLSQVTEGQVTLKQPFSDHALIHTKWLDTANSELKLLEKMAVFAVEVATAEGSASIILQKRFIHN